MSIYDQFTYDIERYLNSKLPELPQSTQMEIGEYISCRVNRLVMEAYDEHERRIRKYTNKPRYSKLRRWTGMNDMHGHEIREGDCLSQPGNVVQCIDTHWYIVNILGATPLEPFTAKQYEIIGNIHNDPELMESDS